MNVNVTARIRRIKQTYLIEGATERVRRALLELVEEMNGPLPDGYPKPE